MNKLHSLTLALAALLAAPFASFGQRSTAFTYQGRLNVSNAPANGYFDLKFGLYAADSGGAMVAGPIAKPPIAVSNGLFSTSLDFGAAAFPGSARWLEISVRPSGSGAAYTTLFPRQRIAAAPYALQAAGIADGVVTANKLSAGAGNDGQVLKMNGGQLAWGTVAGSGGVSSVGTGLGLTGGPITSSGTIAVDTSVVPRLGVANTFSAGPQTVLTGGAANKGLVVRGAAGQTSNLQEWQDSAGGVLAAVTPAGGLAGNGAGLTFLNAANVSAGTLADAQLSGNVSLLNANQTFAGDITFNGANTLANPANTFAGTFFGNGAGLTNLSGAASTNLDGAAVTNLNASNISSGTLADARLSGNVPLLNRHQSFTGSNTFSGASVLTHPANSFAGSFDGSFAGNGSALTSLNAGNVSSGSLADARLSANVALLGGNQSFSGANSFGNAGNSFVGSFTGNGGGLTNLNGANLNNLNAANITSGTLADARLSGNVPLLNRHQSFTGSNTFSGASALTNPANTFAGSFSGSFAGNGSALTSLNAGNVSSGSLADARLSANVPLLGGNQTFAGANTFGNAGNSFVGSFTGNGGGLSNLNGANLNNLNAASITSGTLADARLSSNVPLLNRNQTFTGSNTFSGASALTNPANTFAGGFNGTFAGNGSALTSLNAGNVSSGSLADARLSANVPRLNGNQSFSGSNTFSGVSSFANTANGFVGNFFGNGAGLSNVTASATNVSLALAGDVTGAASNNTVARIRGANVSPSAPAANQHLRFDGANWTPAAVALASDVSGTLSLANGGTAATTALAARANLSAAASGANSDITSLNGLTTPISAAQGGSGQSSYVIGDLLYASGATALSKLADVATGNSLISGGVGATPQWGKVGLATHVSGTLALANGGTAATTASAARANLAAAGSGANADIASLNGLTTPISAAQGGSGQSSYTVGDLLYASGATALSKLADVATGNALISGGIGAAPQWSKIGLATHVSGTLALANGGTAATTASAARANLSAAGSGANSDITSLTGLTTPISAAQGGSGQSSYTVGDLLYASGATALSKLPDVATGSALISGGVGAAPQWNKIGLATHVSGTLALANGGTAATTASAARANLAAAGSGANSDITSLSGLTTPLSASQGGSGISGYSTGDILYAASAGALARRAAGGAGQVLAVSGGVPVWTNASAHDHFGQVWSGAAADGLYVQNTSLTDGAAAFTGVATGATNVNYGVFGQTSSPEGTAVHGSALATNGVAIGVTGQAISPDGTGVYGFAAATSGTNAGVFGESSSPFGTGVFGQALATTGTPVGVFGYTAATNGYGLYTPNRLYVGNNAFIAGNLGIGTGSKLQADSGTNSAPSITFLGNNGAGIYSPGTNVLGLVTSGAERLRLAADGKVGVGRTAATNRFEVEGEASKTTAGGWLANSDAAIKTGVRDLSRALDTIERVRPVAFRYTVEYRRAHPDIEDKEYYNVIAQEFAVVFPESVKASGETLDGKVLLQVDTYPAAIYSIAAIRELHGQVKEREQELAQLRHKNSELETRLAAIERLLSGGSHPVERQ